MNQPTFKGAFEIQQNLGQPQLEGSLAYDFIHQTYRLTGAGTNMWFGSDEAFFAYNKISGDFMIRATIQFVGEGVHAHRKIGIMARNSMDSDSPHANISVHGDTLTSLQYRTDSGADTLEVKLDAYHPTEIAFERKGDVITISAARFGEDYKSVSHTVDLNDEVLAGIYICSHEAEVLESAIFSNVRIIFPADDDFIPYEHYIGSNLEVMTISDGHRKILHSENRSLQAPNWTQDGKHLIYNADGKLYQYCLEKGNIESLDTGDCIDNNNDHVISWDGQQMAISHHLSTDQTSTIYTLPITGSNHPRRITDPEKGHSFLHGWSKDDKSLIFTGQRNDQYDIWTIDIETGEETQLTNEPTLDDGAELSPCGKWIYFNSVRTGTMQIWRMKPDGSEQEQITFDRCNNWFPHFSPDGKWMVYLAYPSSIDPTDHPFYEKVYLKLMPATGGVPKTIAYIYGGQGTINVPSWSPDSQSIAFISNTKM